MMNFRLGQAEVAPPGKDVERKLIAHVPDLLVFEEVDAEDLPSTLRYYGVLFFADISGFTALTERYTVSSDRGADALTVCLNNYIGKIVDHILQMGGDVLKFAGDAILAVWRVRTRHDLPEAVGQAVKCSLIIQRSCDNEKTEVGVKLRVKIAVSAGIIYTHFLGNPNTRQFAMSGRPVAEVNQAEKYCEAGLVVMSPNALEFGLNKYILIEPLPGRFGLVKYLVMNPRRNWTLYVHQPLFLDFADDTKKFHRISMQLEDNVKRESNLRKFISIVVQQKLDDEQPLKYLSEMRNCSIVFINLSFVLDTESRDFQNMQRATIQLAFLIIHEIVTDLYGAINKIFMFDKGCTLLSIFGLPGQKHEHEPANALKAAYTAKLALEKNIPCMKVASFGVTSGNIFCGVIGHPHRHEYTVIGQKVNLAARLMMHYPDIVACDFQTYTESKLSKDVFETLPPKEMKGVGNITVYQYMESARKLAGTTVVIKPKYPIIGFEAELQTYKKLLDKIGYVPSIKSEVIEEVEEEEEEEEEEDDGKPVKKKKKPPVVVEPVPDPRCHILALEGDRGCGKTRLSEEFRWIAAKGNYILYSFEMSLNHRDVPYFFIRSVLESLLEIQSLSPEEKQKKLLENIDSELHEHTYLLDPIFHVNFGNGRIWVPPPVKEVIIPEVVEEVIVEEEEGDEEEEDDMEMDALDEEEGEGEGEEEEEEEIIEDLEPTEFDITSLVLNSLAVHTLGEEHAVLIIDDAQNLDLDSWRYLFTLTDNVNSMVVMEFLPLNDKGYVNPIFTDILKNEKTMFFNITSLNAEEIAAVGCQKIQVDRLPDEVRDVIIEKCYGVPLWCEQLIQEMQKGGLLLITPKEKLAGEYKKGDIQSHGEIYEREAMVMSCTLKEGFNLQKFQVPASIRGTALTRLDRLLPFEQLVMKSAAVAGGTVLFDMLLAVVPGVQMEKLLLATNELILKRSFLCNVNNTEQTLKKFNQMDSDSDSGKSFEQLKHCQRCYCFPDDDSDKEHDFAAIAQRCQQLKFQNYILQETAYNLWLEDQRRSLHKSCAVYLEKIVNQMLVYGTMDRVVMTVYHHAIVGDQVSLNVVQPFEYDMDDNMIDYIENCPKKFFDDSVRTLLTDPSYVRCRAYLDGKDN